MEYIGNVCGCGVVVVVVVVSCDGEIAVYKRIDFYVDACSDSVLKGVVE